MKKNVLLLAGLLVAGLGLTSCGGTPEASESTDTHSENTQTEVSTDTATEDVTPELTYAVATGEFTEFGGGIVDLILDDTKNATFDCTTNAGGDFDLMFDKKGTYSIADGVITVKVHLDAVDIPAQGDNPAVSIPAKDVTYTSVLAEDGTFTMAYTMYGQKNIAVSLVGEWPTGLKTPIASGEFTEFGGGIVDLILDDTKNATFDCTTNAGGDFDLMFDKKGTYSIADGVITVKVHLDAVDIPAQGDNPAVSIPAKDVTYTSVLAEDGTFTMAYTMYGQKNIAVSLVGEWPAAAK